MEAGLVGSFVDLRVVDRGPGVPLAERDRIFVPFQRFGDRSHDAGAGLGLAIAKGFIDAMGAGMELDDTPGGGLTITIRLMIIEPPTQPSTQPYTQPPTQPPGETERR